MPDSSNEPRWLSRLVVEAIHHDVLATNGGLPGIRDESLLEAALARPRQVLSYGADIDFPALAAACAYGIARNHPFHDGNKRMAFMTMAVFVELNGMAFVASEAEVVATMLALAAGEIEEAELAAWARGHLREREASL